MSVSADLSSEILDITADLEVVLRGEDGKSAYEVAVDNGFVGTEQEWLDSLKGEADRAEAYTQEAKEYRNASQQNAIAAGNQANAARLIRDETQAIRDGFAPEVANAMAAIQAEKEEAEQKKLLVDEAAENAHLDRVQADADAEEVRYLLRRTTEEKNVATDAAERARIYSETAVTSSTEAAASEANCAQMWEEFQQFPQNAEEYAIQAGASAQAAAQSESLAAGSASSASASATAAANSAGDSSDSATAAAASAQAAAASAQEATTQAQAAEASATASANSANASATSATGAAESASNAAQSERNIAGAEEATAASAASAASSAEGAATSASAAATSATDAADSADSASASATSAANSASDAAASATAAANSASEAHGEVENVLNSIDAAVDRELDIILPQQLAGKLDVGGKAVDSAHADDADTVNHHTVLSDVPANAAFTDTTYDTMTAAEATAGTGTTARVITAKVLADKIAEAIASLVNSAPSTLDTLNELAAALGNDPSFATTIATALGNKLDKAGGTVTGNLAVSGTITASGSVTGKSIHVTPENAAGEGGQINLVASRNTENSLSIDNLCGVLRVFGQPSADGTTKIGNGTVLAIDPYTKTIVGGYTLTGNVTGSSGSCTGNAANVTGTVAIANGGTGATTRLGAVQSLLGEGVGTNAQHFFTLTDNFTKAGWSSVADIKNVLDIVDKSNTQTIAGAKTFSGTVTITKSTDASGTANNSPALIVGGAATAGHIELDNNEIMAKGSGTTPGTLSINNDGGLVQVGPGGVTTSGKLITSATSDQIRIKRGNYSIMFHNDGSAFYLLKTASGSPDGSWDGTRPLTVNLSTGACSINGNAATALKIYGKTIPVVSSFDSSTGTLALTSLS